MTAFESIDFNDENSGKYGLPSEASLPSVLDLHVGEQVSDLIPPVLLGPIEDLMARPRKSFRAELVGLGYQLAGRGEATGSMKPVVDNCALVVELLHAGSLAIDDIEDGSAMRRGEPSLHSRYGLSVALNAGNWLYFWPLERIRAMQLPAETELGLYRAYHRTMSRAHMGQALDVGIPIDTLPQARIYSTCLSSLELKSGALTALALLMGAILAGADPNRLKVLEEFGHGFGIALQMLDDLGNVSGKKEPWKQFEDLRLRRPSWVWACASVGFDEKEFSRFVKAVSQLPDAGELEEWLTSHPEFLAQCRERALEFLASTEQKLRRGLVSRGELALALELLGRLEERLAGSYE